MAELVAGWLGERLGVRAIGIIGIEGGLSNLFYRLDWLCRREGRHITLAPQNTVKKLAAKTSDAPNEKHCNATVSTWIGRLIFRSCCRQRVESSEKQGSESFLSVSGFGIFRHSQNQR